MHESDSSTGLVPADTRRHCDHQVRFLDGAIDRTRDHLSAAARIIANDCPEATRHIQAALRLLEEGQLPEAGERQRCSEALHGEASRNAQVT